MTNEIEWREIPSFPVYELNKKGEVRVQENQVHVLANTSPNVGVQVSLWRDGSYRTKTILEVMCETFPENMKTLDEHFADDKEKLTKTLTEELSMLICPDHASTYEQTALAIVERIIKEGWSPNGS